MLPVNNIQSLSRNNQATQVNFDQLLINQWKKWAENGIHGGGEERDIALYRLTDCLERETNRLDLDHLNLTSLPDNLPPSVTQLNICGNPLTSLDSDKLAQSISVLILSRNQIPLLIGRLISVPRLEISDAQTPLVINPSRIN